MLCNPNTIDAVGFAQKSPQASNDLFFFWGVIVNNALD